MAQEEIIFKLGVDTGDSVQDVNKVSDAIEEVGKDVKKSEGSFVNLRKELKTLTIQLQNLDPASKEFETVAKRAGQIKEQMRGVADAINDADPEKFGGKFQRTAEGIAGAFSAVTGAQALFGQQSEEIEKQMLKVQGAIALTQGISAMKELRNDATDLFEAVKTGGVNAFKALQKAIGSTGIGLLLVALGTVVAYWDEIKTAVNGVSDSQKKLNDLAKKNVESENEKMNTLNKQDNILKLQGKTEDEILKIKKAQTEQQIKALNISIKNDEITLKSQINAAKRNNEIIKGLTKIGLEVSVIAFRVLVAPFDLLIATYNKIAPVLNLDKIDSLNSKLSDLTKFGSEQIAKLAFDPKDIEEKGLQAIKENKSTLLELQNQRAGYILDLKNKNKQENNNQKESNKEKLKQEKEDLEKQEQDKLALKRKYEDLMAANITDTNVREQTELKLKHQRELEELAKQYGDKKLLKEDYDKTVLELEKNQNAELNLLTETQKKAQTEKDNLDAKSKLEAELIRAEEDFALKQQKRIELENLDFAQQLQNKDLTNGEIEKITAQHEANIVAINIESKDRQIEIDNAIAEAKFNLANNIGGAIGAIGSLFEQGSKQAKAFALIQLGIDTATGFMSALRIAQQTAAGTGPAAAFTMPIFYAQQIASVIGAVSKAKSILGSGTSVQAPRMNTPTAQSNTPTQQGTQQTIQAQSTYKVVVVDSDITKMQDKTKKVQAISTI